MQGISVHALDVYPSLTAASSLNRVAPMCEHDSPRLQDKQFMKAIKFEIVCIMCQNKYFCIKLLV